QVQGQAGNPVDDVQIVEITRLGLQTVQDEMDLLEAEGYTQAYNDRSGKSAMLIAPGRRLLQELAAQRARPASPVQLRQRILEYLASREDAEGRAFIDDDAIASAVAIPSQRAQDLLQGLEDAGLVELTGYE